MLDVATAFPDLGALRTLLRPQEWRNGHLDLWPASKPSRRRRRFTSSVLIRLFLPTQAGNVPLWLLRTYYVVSKLPLLPSRLSSYLSRDSFLPLVTAIAQSLEVFGKHPSHSRDQNLGFNDLLTAAGKGDNTKESIYPKSPSVFRTVGQRPDGHVAPRTRLHLATSSLIGGRELLYPGGMSFD